MDSAQMADKTLAMGIRRRHIFDALPVLALGIMVCTVLTVAGTSRSSMDDLYPPTHSHATTKTELLDSLALVNGVACDPGGVFLFADDTPLMVIWMASEPAELYNGVGDFAGLLSMSELAMLMDTTRMFTESCMADNVAWGPISEPDRVISSSYPL